MEVDTLPMEKPSLGFPCSQNLINDDTVLSLRLNQEYSTPRKHSTSPYKMAAISPRMENGHLLASRPLENGHNHISHPMDSHHLSSHLMENSNNISPRRLDSSNHISPRKSDMPNHLSPRAIINPHLSPRAMENSYHLSPRALPNPHMSPRSMENHHMSPRSLENHHLSPRVLENSYHLSPRAAENPHLSPRVLSNPHLSPRAQENLLFSPRPSENSHHSPRISENPHHSPRISENPHLSPRVSENPHFSPRASHHPHLSPRQAENSHFSLRVSQNAPLSPIAMENPHDSGHFSSSYMSPRCAISPRTPAHIVAPTTPHMQLPNHVSSSTPNIPSHIMHSPRPASCPEHELMETEIESTRLRLPSLTDDQRPGSEDLWRQSAPPPKKRKRSNLEDIVKRMKEDTGSEGGSIAGDTDSKSVENYGYSGFGRDENNAPNDGESEESRYYRETGEYPDDRDLEMSRYEQNRERELEMNRELDMNREMSRELEMRREQNRDGLEYPDTPVNREAREMQDRTKDAKTNESIKMSDEEKMNEIVKMENMINNHNMLSAKRESPFINENGFMSQQQQRMNGWYPGPFNGSVPPSPILPPNIDQSKMPSPFFPMMPNQFQTPETEKDYLKCQYCERTFRRQKNLENHIENAHGNGHVHMKKPESGNALYFKCTHCPYTTKHQSNLYVHIRIHTGERPYICGACGVQYSQSHSLKSHIINKHDGIMSYYIKEKRNRSPRSLSYVSHTDRATFKHNGSPILPSFPPEFIPRNPNGIPFPFDSPGITLEHQQNIAAALMNGQIPIPPQHRQQQHLVEALIANQLKQKAWAEQKRSAELALKQAEFHDEAIDLSKKVIKDEPRFEDSTPSPLSEDSLHDERSDSRARDYVSAIREERYIREDEAGVKLADGYLESTRFMENEIMRDTRTVQEIREPKNEVLSNGINAVEDRNAIDESLNLTRDESVNESMNVNNESMNLKNDSLNQVNNEVLNRVNDLHDCSHVWKLRTLRKNVMRMLSILVPNLNFEEKGITSESDSVDDLLQDVIESNIGEAVTDESERN